MKKQWLLDALDGPSKTAEALGITPASVSGWGDDLPDSVIGKVARLRPDLMRAYWANEGMVERRQYVRRKIKGRRSGD